MPAAAQVGSRDLRIPLVGCQSLEQVKQYTMDSLSVALGPARLVQSRFRAFRNKASRLC